MCGPKKRVDRDSNPSNHINLSCAKLNNHTGKIRTKTRRNIKSNSGGIIKGYYLSIIVGVESIRGSNLRINGGGTEKVHRLDKRIKLCPNRHSSFKIFDRRYSDHQ